VVGNCRCHHGKPSGNLSHKIRRRLMNGSVQVVFIKLIVLGNYDLDEEVPSVNQNQFVVKQQTNLFLVLLISIFSRCWLYNRFGWWFGWLVGWWWRYECQIYNDKQRTTKVRLGSAR
jgi:hypothetical protein